MGMKTLQLRGPNFGSLGTPKFLVEADFSSDKLNFFVENTGLRTANIKVGILNQNLIPVTGNMCACDEFTCDVHSVHP